MHKYYGQFHGTKSVQVSVIGDYYIIHVSCGWTILFCDCKQKLMTFAKKMGGDCRNVDFVSG